MVSSCCQKSGKDFVTCSGSWTTRSGNSNVKMPKAMAMRWSEWEQTVVAPCRRDEGRRSSVAVSVMSAPNAFSSFCRASMRSDSFSRRFLMPRIRARMPRAAQVTSTGGSRSGQSVKLYSSRFSCWPVPSTVTERTLERYGERTSRVVTPSRSKICATTLSPWHELVRDSPGMRRRMPGTRAAAA